MTETRGIHSDVTNLYYRSLTPQSMSSGLPYKRRILDRWTTRIRASGLSGTELVADYLHEKYIKNLSFHTSTIAALRFWPFNAFSINKEVQY